MHRFLALILLSCLVSTGKGQVPSVDIHLVELTRAGGELSFSAPRNATDRPGYDNQPSFLPDSGSFFYTSMHEDAQADAYRFDIAKGASERITETTESEYSPTPRPDGRFTCVRVEADSTQRLWSFAADGSDPQVVLEDVTGIGYHAWGNENELILFVLGEPHELHRANRRTGHSEVVVKDIGRSLHKIPGRTAWSFCQPAGEELWRVRALDLESGEQTDLIDAPGPGSQDCAWTPWGTLWMVHAGVLFEWDPETEAGWQERHDLGAVGLEGITRLAVSPDGRWLAVVAAEATPESDD